MDSRARIFLISIAMALAGSGMIGRLFYLQVVHGAEFSIHADRQYAVPQESSGLRGSIYFQDKEGSLISAASLQTEYILAINPTKVLDAEALYESLSALIPLDRAAFDAKVSRTDDPYEEIAYFTDREIARHIAELDDSAVNIFSRQKRFYPAEGLASHVLGFVGKTADSGDTFVGRYGVEQYFDGVLAREGGSLYVNIFAELFAGVSAAIGDGTDRRAGDIVLTIEPHVQEFLETELRAYKATWNASSLGAVIIEPRTGKIRALAALPDFNPAAYNSVTDAGVFLNPLTQRVYEMGSVVKPFTVAAGLDAEVITPTTTYFDSGKRELNGRTISNYDGKGRGTVTIQDILNKSLNTGTVFIAEKLGADLFREYFMRFGFGERTGIMLPGEASGLVDNLESARLIEHATASFGQGIAMTPLSLARALAVFGNGGTLMKPMIAEKIIYSSGGEVRFEPSAVSQPIRKETADTITRMLVRVVDEALLNGTVKLDRYSIAAKTGTAQIAGSAGGYYDDRFLHSFFGYFPAYEPRFLVLIYAENPRGANYASQTLTDPFMRITQFLLNYYSIPPDRELAS